MASASRDLDILLVGKTGSGKSATGNSITGRKSFISQRKMASVTKIAQFEYSEFEGREIKVVDTPGLGDTSMNPKKGFDLVVQAVKEAIVVNPQGYHAILMIVKYDERFGEDNVKTVKQLKSIFGEGFIENHGILIFTCGDKFKEEDGANMTFEDWVKDQADEPKFTALVQECGNRYVLFDNRTKEENERVKQLRHLIEVIDNLTVDNRRYTNEQFKKAGEDRQKMYDDLGRPVLKEDIIKKTGLINQELSRLTSNITKSNSEYVLGELQNIKRKASEIYQMVVEQDKGSVALKVGLRTVSNLQDSINYEIDLVVQLITKSEKEAELQKEMEKLRLEKEQYEAKKQEEEEERQRQEKDRLLQEELRKKEESQRQQKLGEEKKRIEEERKHIEEEKRRAEEEERKREEIQRHRIEEERRALGEEQVQIQKVHRRYTNEQFKKAGEERQNMYHDLGKQVPREETIRNTDLITQELRRLTSHITKSNPEHVLDELQKMKRKASEFYQMVEKQDKGSGELKSGLKNISNLRDGINCQLDFVLQLEIEKLRLEKEQYKARKEIEEEEHQRKEKDRLRQEEQRKRLNEKEEEQRKGREEKLRTEQEKSQESEREYQQMKTNQSRRIIQKAADGVSWVARSNTEGVAGAWNYIFG